MKKNNISTKSWIISVVLAILGVLAIRFNGKPEIYTGIYFAIASIFLIGLFTNRFIGTIFGGLIITIGLILRLSYPEGSKLTGDKLKAFLIEEQAYKDFISSYFILLILAGLVIGFVAGLIGEMLKESKSGTYSANKITYMALFIALGVVINTVRIGSISFGGFPIILSGYLLGPIPGFIIGALSDILGFIIRPSGFGFNPIFTLTSALTGAIPVIVTRLLGERYPRYSFIKVLIGVFVGQMLTSVILVPIFSQLLYMKIFSVEATKAFIKQIVSIPVYSFLIVSLNDRLSKVIKFDKII